MNRIIPIFPLNLVVFPNSKYPLHIFEPRYKRMVNECLENNSGFGVVAAFKNKISDVGVLVKIIDVLKKYDSGEMDIIVEGIERFLINQTKLHPDGYYVSEIESYNDNKYEIDYRLVDKLQLHFEKIIELANYKLDDKFWENLSKSEFKSFKIAEKSGLKYEQQQELLILRSENARLNYLINYFEEIKDKIDDSQVMKNIVMNDGYLN